MPVPNGVSPASSCLANPSSASPALANSAAQASNEHPPENGEVTVVEVTPHIPLIKLAAPERNLSQYRLTRASRWKCLALGIGGGALAGAGAGALVGVGVGVLGGLFAGPVGVAIGAAVGALVGGLAGGVAGTAIGTGLAVKRILRSPREEIKRQIRKAETELASIIHKQQVNGRKIKASWNKLVTIFDFRDEKGFREQLDAEMTTTRRMKGELNDLRSQLTDVQGKISAAEVNIKNLINLRHNYQCYKAQHGMLAAHYQANNQWFRAQHERSKARSYSNKIDGVNREISAEKARLARDPAYQALCKEKRDLTQQESAKKAEYEQQCERELLLIKHADLLSRRKSLVDRGSIRAKVRARHYENYLGVGIMPTRANRPVKSAEREPHDLRHMLVYG